MNTGNFGGTENTISVGPKRRGRPATGRDPFVKVRMPPDIIQAIERWAAKSQDLDRSAAIRSLVELGLHAGRKKRPRVRSEGIPQLRAQGPAGETAAAAARGPSAAAACREQGVLNVRRKPSPDHHRCEDHRDAP